MKVALINPPYAWIGRSMRPLGLVALAAHINREFKADVTCEVFDFSDERASAYAELLSQFRVSNFQLVGFSTYTTNFNTTLQWAAHLKEECPNIKTVIGGHHASETASNILKNYYQVFDYVVAGEGELPLAELCAALLAGEAFPKGIQGLYHRESLPKAEVPEKAEMIPDLDSLAVPVATIRSPYSRPLVHWDRIEKRARAAIALVSSRGCPYGCDFCSLRRKRWRALTTSRLFEWIEALEVFENLTAEHIYFMDALLFTHPERVREIGTMIDHRRKGTTWSGSARADQIVRLADDIPTLASQGLRFVEIGIESGSQSALNRYAKGTTVEQNLSAIYTLRKSGIDIALDFIMFHPDAEVANLLENLDFLRRAGLTEFLPHDHFYTYLSPYPGTPIRGFYENLFQQSFPLHELPNPLPLFTDNRVQAIFESFVVAFKPQRSLLANLLKEVDTQAVRLRIENPAIAQQLRLEAITLRHIPFRLLHALCISDGAQHMAHLRGAENELQRIQAVVSKVTLPYEKTYA